MLYLNFFLYFPFIFFLILKFVLIRFINDLLHHKERLKESGRKWKEDSYEKEVLIVEDVSRAWWQMEVGKWTIAEPSHFGTCSCGTTKWTFAAPLTSVNRYLNVKEVTMPKEKVKVCVPKRTRNEIWRFFCWQHYMTFQEIFICGVMNFYISYYKIVMLI